MRIFQNDSPSYGHRGSLRSIREVPLPPILPLQKCERRKEAWIYFLLASVDVAAQAAGEPLAASLAREINLLHLAISYHTHPAHFHSVFVSLRGSEPPCSV